MLIKSILIVFVVIATSFWIAKGQKRENTRLVFVGFFYFFGLVIATTMLYDWFLLLFNKLIPQ